MAHSSRNPSLAGGVSRYSRSAMFAKKAAYKKKMAKAAKKAPVVAQPKTKKVGGDKNGGERKVAHKSSKFYPAEDIPRPMPRRAMTGATKLRSSITPGTVLILLAGRHQGRRVVFLKQLDSGLLLVTGPYKVNGVPLRRVNQAYVIATSTKVDVSGVKVDAKFNDAYFADNKPERSEEGGRKANETRVADQKAVDAAVLGAVGKEAGLKAYLKARFTLTNGQFPHEMKF